MKALFIGGTGLISTAVTKLAVEKGMELTLLNRGKHSGCMLEGVEVIEAYEAGLRRARG